MTLKEIMWGWMEHNAPDIPTWFVKGRVVLIAMDECQGKPDQYRPITCLNTSYKLLTAVLMEVLYEHAVLHSILPEEQYTVRRRHKGCLDALLKDSMVAREAKLRRCSLSVTWLDYKKAYDSVPHDWVLFLLQYINAPVVVAHIVATSFDCGRWCSLWGRANIELAYRHELFQVDSISLLLYYLSIAPLSMALRSAGGFKVNYGDTVLSIVDRVS